MIKSYGKSSKENIRKTNGQRGLKMQKLPVRALAMLDSNGAIVLTIFTGTIIVFLGA